MLIMKKINEWNEIKVLHRKFTKDLFNREKNKYNKKNPVINDLINNREMDIWK